MFEVPLHFRDGHYFLELNGDFWVLDTGAPTSFGASQVALAGKIFDVDNQYLGVTAAMLQQHVGVPWSGILGADVLGDIDLVLDAGAAKATIPGGELSAPGEVVYLDQFMGIRLYP